MDFTYYSTEQTLEKIRSIIDEEESGVYLRFGDGDMNLGRGVSELYQGVNPELSALIRDAIQLVDKNVLKALPLHNKEWNTSEEGMFGGNHEAPSSWCENMIRSFYEISNTQEVEFYSPVALSHQAVQNSEKTIEFLKFIGDKVKYFIGNKNIPREVLEVVFNKDIIHIKTPERNSFDKFWEIYNEFVAEVGDDNEYSVVVTSMGCSGRAIQKQIWDNYSNLFLFDFGSLMDSLCGWNTRAWIELTDFDKDNFLRKLVSVKEEKR